MPGLEITCTSCGEDALLRREPVYEGFKKTGEKLLCSSCGHEFPDEDSVPFKQKKAPSIFSDDEKPTTLDIFSDDDTARNCRHCKHYVVNPFTQRCGLHNKVVEATDACFDFEQKDEDAEEGSEESS